MTAAQTKLYHVHETQNTHIYVNNTISSKGDTSNRSWYMYIHGIESQNFFIPVFMGYLLFMTLPL